jgi:cytochrome c553
MKKNIIVSIAALTVASSLLAAVPGSCFGCHGKDGSKNTMAKASKPNTMTKAEMATSLKGYRAGTVNKFKKGKLMSNFAKKLTDAQITDISNTWGK